jgi:hypothetical protein
MWSKPVPMTIASVNRYSTPADRREPGRPAPEEVRAPVKRYWTTRPRKEANTLGGIENRVALGAADRIVLTPAEVLICYFRVLLLLLCMVTSDSFRSAVTRSIVPPGRLCSSGVTALSLLQLAIEDFSPELS